MKVKRANETSEEPDVSDPEAVRVLLKLPNGQRLERRLVFCWIIIVVESYNLFLDSY